MDACAAQPAIFTNSVGDHPARPGSHLIAATRRLLDAIRQPSEIDATWSRASSGQFHLLPRRSQDRLLNSGCRR
jgi:hypothetical protein